MIEIAHFQLVRESIANTPYVVEIALTSGP